MTIMNKNSLDATLVDALCAINLPKLPPIWDGENYYLHAVVKVRKCDNSEAYCLMSKDVDGNDNIVRTFGSVCAIKNIEEVYPYSFLQAKYIPEAKSKAEKIEFLKRFHNLKTTEQFEGMKLKELDNEIIKTVIMQQLKDENFNKRH